MRSKVFLILTAFAAGIAGAFVFWLIMPTSEKVYINEVVQPPTGFVTNTNRSSNNQVADFVLASSASRPCVVYINTVANRSQNGWFDWYFNGSSQVASSGSGVIYTNDGYIVTNNHVIENSDKIEVVHEKRSYSAKVIGTDPSTDLAVLKIEAKDLTAIKIGSSKVLQVGEWVLAVGNPFNLTSTVTAGIVSAKARNINVVNSQFPIESFIQTDAAINPGNSGGALVNMKGELVGINTAILSKTGSYAGYGFAVPVDIAIKVVKDLVKYGEVQKAFIGADVVEVTTAIAQQLKLEDYSGVVVTYIQKEGAAEKIGLEKGDVILKINDQEVNSKSAFDEQLSYHNPGDKIKITYRRDGKIKEGEITLTNREGTTEKLKHEVYSSTVLGANFEVISKVEKDKLGIANGVRVVQVKNGFIQRLGISEGFIITSVNKTKVVSAEQLEQVLQSVKGRVDIEGITANGVRGYYSYYF